MINNSWITAQAFEKIGYYPHHGIDIILSSIWTNQSCGIGEFYDLIPLIDWCKEVGFDIIQLLPINDTHDQTSPYLAVSSSALNPIFLSLWKLPKVQKSDLDRFHPFQKTVKVPYQEILQQKMLFLHEYYQSTKKPSDYIEFLGKHEWLSSYSAFKSEKSIENFSPDFFSYLQYLCFEQMSEVKRYANSQGIFLKGDIPILINKESADVHLHPEFFDLRYTAGAPPDQYAEDGQNWGFPLYNWQALKNEGFSWWKQRLQFAENFFDIYRLDHIIGFFRIWAIELGKKAKEGFFIPSDPKEQQEQGLSIFTQLLPATSMLPIGEDLGFNTVIAQTNMAKLGIAGTKVIRWMRKYDQDGSFIAYRDYPELALCTVSTHDSETLALWWQNFPEEAKEFSKFSNIEYEPILTKANRTKILQDSHSANCIFHINLLSEYLALFDELVSPRLEDERINIPGKILDTNWTYKMKISLEELSNHEPLKQAVRSILPKK